MERDARATSEREERLPSNEVEEEEIVSMEEFLKQPIPQTGIFLQRPDQVDGRIDTGDGWR